MRNDQYQPVNALAAKSGNDEGDESATKGTQPIEPPHFAATSTGNCGAQFTA